MSEDPNFRFAIWRTWIAFGLLSLLAGCSLDNAPMLDPKGPIALAERDLLFTATAVMLIVVVPVFLLTFWVVFRYRASANNPDYQPEWDRSNLIESVIWLVPALIVIVIGTMVWKSSHKLDPYRAIPSEQATLNVQVIALDWKWLFIYPDHDIAVVNELAFPVDAPVHLSLTSDTVMNSLAIPALAGQIYVMAGMQTELNLLATEAGTYAGRNLQYSGDGFPDQVFNAIAMPPGDFDQWLSDARQSQFQLDASTYGELARPSEAHPVEYFRDVDPRLYQAVYMKYMHDHAAPPATAIDPTEGGRDAR